MAVLAASVILLDLSSLPGKYCIMSFFSFPFFLIFLSPSPITASNLAFQSATRSSNS
jgi:hypothetical protein